MKEDKIALSKYERISKTTKLNVVHAYAHRKQSGIMVKAIAFHHNISQSKLYEIIHEYEREHHVTFHMSNSGGYRKHPNHVNQYR